MKTFEKGQQVLVAHTNKELTYFFLSETRDGKSVAVEYEYGGVWQIYWCKIGQISRPKVKREGWVNIYPSTVSATGVYSGDIHLTKDAALASANKASLIDTIKIEWEEEA